jgi:predicted transposase YbfD/YdcC
MKRDFTDYFSDVEDPRVVGRCSHLLSDILLSALCTYLTGGSDYQDMHLLAKERGSPLNGILQPPNGAPSADTFERVFKQLAPDALKECLVRYGQDILSVLAEKQIVLDGARNLGGVSPTSKGNSGLYILNAWVSENSLCVGQEKVKDKSNEITAIPKLLNSLDTEDAVVSIDAIGTQIKIAEQIRNKQGHYILSVKSNQQELLDDMECAFKTHNGYHSVEDWDYGHGRIETRKCSILLAKDFLLEENLSACKDLTTLIKVDSTREINDLMTTKTRYYISNENNTNAAYYNALVRGHWTIENKLHWHLDITFKEDMCRARTGYAPENLSTIRKLALQMITNKNDKLSLKKRQYKTALDTKYMIELIKF